jgi:hypothetical protein
MVGVHRMETLIPMPQAPVPEQERLAYSVQEAADFLGVDYFSVHEVLRTYA